MVAGRELDALVAEKVFGQPRECRLIGVGTADDPTRLEPINGVWRCRTENEDYWERWSPDGADRVVNDLGVAAYSTDIAAAWEVVEKLKADGWDIHIDSIGFNNDIEGEWRTFFSLDNKGGDQVAWVFEDGDTAPHAIALAALKACAASIPTEGET